MSQTPKNHVLSKSFISHEKPPKPSLTWLEHLQAWKNRYIEWFRTDNMTDPLHGSSAGTLQLL